MRRTAALAVTVAALVLVIPAAPGTTAAVTPAAPWAAPAIPGAARFTGHVPATTREVIVVSAPTWRSHTGTVSLYQRGGSGWTRVVSTPARLGARGLVLATQRVQGTSTTPAGLFTITEAFGRQTDPGTALPYVHVGADHWWVQDRRSAYYNQMRLGSQAGFARTQYGYNGSERLASKGAQYDYVAVIDFNRPHPVIGRGSGIFLHAFGDLTTVGCVSVERSRMRSILRWLRPTAHPRIVIGEDSWLATPARA
jgi:L,D-peptidoglycan transpeptidase YkuD (ErfK/YbiS/YcfS/YnhG family)